MQDVDGTGWVHFHGRPLRVRELQAEDRARIEGLLAQVTAPDLQMRFFSAFRQVPPGLVDYLMRTDGAGRLIVVAVLREAWSEVDGEILAVARAHQMTQDSAEMALLVRSDLKGHGLGSLLLGSLIARCCERGISRLIAEVMRRNSRMMRLAAKYGFRCESVEQDTCHLVLNLYARFS